MITHGNEGQWVAWQFAANFSLDWFRMPFFLAEQFQYFLHQQCHVLRATGMGAIFKDVPAVLIHLGQPPAGVDLRSGERNAMLLRRLNDPLPQPPLAGEIRQNVQHAMLFAGTKSHQKLKVTLPTFDWRAAVPLGG